MTGEGPDSPLGAMPVPLTEIPEDVRRRLEELGGAPADLYRALAHNPALLSAWIEFAWALRSRSRTPRSIRELMILRSAQLMKANYQWRDHTAYARDAGVAQDQIDALDRWESSSRFSPPERAAISLTEAVLAHDVTDEVWRELREQFDDAECVELLMTAGFYAMVPRVLSALRLEPTSE